MVSVENLPKDKKYRSNLDIARDMLLVATVKAKKTRIMYQANLSYGLLDKYLKSLLENGLVECDDSICYVITKKGKDFLQMFDEFLERHRRIREEIQSAKKDKLLLESMCFNTEQRNFKRKLSDQLKTLQ